MSHVEVRLNFAIAQKRAIGGRVVGDAASAVTLSNLRIPRGVTGQTRMHFGCAATQISGYD